jgi:hypothetical protein
MAANPTDQPRGRRGEAGRIGPRHPNTLARALEVGVRELFTFPERGARDRTIDLLSTAKPAIVRSLIEWGWKCLERAHFGRRWPNDTQRCGCVGWNDPSHHPALFVTAVGQPNR